MKFNFKSAGIHRSCRAISGIAASAVVTTIAIAQPATQTPRPDKQQTLIPIRGVPFGPAQQLPTLPAAQRGAYANQPINAPPRDASESTQQPVSLLPTETAARQAAAVAASVVPPEKAAQDITTLAGEYSYGNGFDMNCTLEISPDGRFLFKRCDCAEVVDQATGQLVLNETGQLVLTPAAPRDAWPRGTAPVLVPVTWGQRLYLVPEDDMVGFLNQINRGTEPVTRGSMGNYYLREGDWDRPVEGTPDLPDEWEKYILASPLKGVVAGKDPSGRWIINVGIEHGAYNGMELTALRTDGRRFVTLHITESGTDTSAVELVEPRPELSIQGWNVFSRISPVTPEEK